MRASMCCKVCVELLAVFYVFDELFFKFRFLFCSHRVQQMRDYFIKSYKNEVCNRTVLQCNFISVWIRW